MDNKIFYIQDLVGELNQARHEYYNLNNPSMSDKGYDIKFSELETLELETGYVLSNSPTQTVGYEVVSKLKKVEHSIPLKSLDKTKDINELVKWAKDKDVILMLKADGLTIELIYNDGKLIQASTRGNGLIGEDVTHNVRTFKNIPLIIPYKGYLKISGEAVIHYNDFKKINDLLPEGEKYKTPRNLAAGSVRQLNSEVCSEREVYFYAFNIIECSEVLYDSKKEQFKWLGELGFWTIHYMYGTGIVDELELNINRMKELAEGIFMPIDGLVLSFDSVLYSKSLGETNHHPLHSIAYKFEDELCETTFRGIEINTTRTGMGSLTAIFDPVEIDGTMVERASVHNLDIFEALELGVGDTITVYKANMIIPQIEDNLTRSGTYKLDMICPSCGEEFVIKQPKEARFLYCQNASCKSQLINKLVHFVSREGMNIEGLSEATLEKFVEEGFIESLPCIYSLDMFKENIVKLSGFGKKSYGKLIKSIESSKDVSMENFVYALGIKDVGKGTAKILSQYFENNIHALLSASVYELLKIKDIGVTTANSIYEYLNNTDNIDEIMELLSYCNIKQTEVKQNDGVDLTGKIFVVTGSFENYKPRKLLEDLIESLGGKVTSSVNKNTFALITNDTDTGTKKNQDAVKHGVKIMSEAEFENFIKG